MGSYSVRAPQGAKGKVRLPGMGKPFKEKEKESERDEKQEKNGLADSSLFLKSKKRVQGQKKGRDRIRPSRAV